MRSSWPPADIVQQLTMATGILLDRYNYDQQGHERLRIAQRLAEEWLQTQGQLVQTITVHPDGSVEYGPFTPPA